jgi:hypothetical protein
MPSLGSGLSLGTLNKIPGYDFDASAYFDSTGITDAVTRAKINNFVVGVKNLGLWSSFICWPLKSSQNKGSGTTAYSLGGFGPYNGSFVSSPTWGVDGVTFNGSNSIGISTLVGSSRVNRFAFGVGKITGYTANRFFDIQDGSSNTRRNPFLGMGSFGSFDTIFTLPNSFPVKYLVIVCSKTTGCWYISLSMKCGKLFLVTSSNIEDFLKGRLAGLLFLSKI